MCPARYVRLGFMLSLIRTLSEGPVQVELAYWNGELAEKTMATKPRTSPEGWLVVSKTVPMGTGEMAQRLRREAEVARKLKHRNIVPLLAVEGTTLIYAYAEGVSLYDYMQREPVSISHALELTHDVLKALDYAHSQRVIHCDIKPSNIILQTDSRRQHGQRALLNDFGFAKDLALSAITSEGMRLGTPNYMSPEQFAGVRDNPRSDIYAVGATLYHVLCGFPPYEGNVIPFLLGHPSFLKPLPTEASFLQEVILKALASEPMERFASARAMRKALLEVTS